MSEEAEAVGKETDKSAKEFSLSDFFVAKVEPIQCKSKKSKKKNLCRDALKKI
jgi:hypothetical protein